MSLILNDISAFGDARLPDRFWSKATVDDATGCWIWQAALDMHGYGVYYAGPGNPGGANVGAHRFAYLALVGDVAEGLVLDHLCRQRSCCNPAHLDQVTNVENVLRGQGITAVNAKKTHCNRGHEFTPENTDWFGKGRRHRRCRECSRESHRRWSASNRDKVNRYQRERWARLKALRGDDHDGDR